MVICVTCENYYRREVGRTSEVKCARRRLSKRRRERPLRDNRPVVDFVRRTRTQWCCKIHFFFFQIKFWVVKKIVCLPSLSWKRPFRCPRRQKSHGNAVVLKLRSVHAYHYNSCRVDTWTVVVRSRFWAWRGSYCFYNGVDLVFSRSIFLFD